MQTICAIPCGCEGCCFGGQVMRIWDIIDKTEPGLQITQPTRHKDPIVGSAVSSLAKVALVAAVVAASACSIVRVDGVLYAGALAARTQILGAKRIAPRQRTAGGATD